MNRLNLYLFATVFITGAGVLILEVAAVRQLSPYYGSSLYVFSSVLSVILAALSVGYWYGGKRADRKQSVRELYTIIVLSGLLVLLLELAATIVLPLHAAALGPQIGPLFFSLVLFFVPAFLLGIVSPYIIKIQSLHTPSEHIGSVVGKTFFWGTAGSIVGSVTSGFWLIPSFGIQLSILIVGVALILLGLIVPILIGKKHALLSVAVVLILGSSLLAAIKWYDTADTQAYLYNESGLYSSIKISQIVLNGQAARLLNRDTNNSSVIYNNSYDLPFTYTQFSEFYPVLAPGSERFLLLGGGAYTIPRTLVARDPDIIIDVVEIEPALFELAQQYFDLTDVSRINNHAMDARVFLQQTDAVYDVIFIDVFGTDLAAPFHLTTQEFYELARSRLTPNGVLMINTIGVLETEQPSLVGSVLKTIVGVFPNTAVYPIKLATPKTLQNIMVISRNGAEPITLDEQTVTGTNSGETIFLADIKLPLTDFDFAPELILTDDRAPVELLQMKQ